VSDEIAAALITVVFAVPTTLLAGYFLFRLNRERLEVKWALLSSLPLVTRPSGRSDIRVVVRASLLDPSDDSTDFKDITEFWIYQVRLRNSGTKTIDEFKCVFRAGDGARIVQIEPQHAYMGGKWVETKLQTDGEDPYPNFAVATIPFLNEKQSVILTVSVVDATSPEIEVHIGAPGLQVDREVARTLTFQQAVRQAGLAVVDALRPFW